MALKDLIPFGVSLPHRSPDTIGMEEVKHVAQRAEALGFRDLWVTENTLDHVVVLAYAAAGRDPEAFPISKRVFMAVDEKPERARAELNRWFTEVYRNPPGTDASGIWGTPEQVREKLEALVAMGANHLLLNPVSRYAEQLEAVAEVVGLSA